MHTSTTFYVHNENGYNSAMKNLPLQMRPREKLIAQGAQALTDIELLIVKEEQYDTNYDTVIYAVCARKKN